MKCKIPEISWHNRDPVLSVDIQPKTEQSSQYRLASGGTDSHVLIWSLSLTDSGEVILDVAADLTRHQRAVNVVKWSPNGKLLASGDDESVVFIWKQKDESEPLMYVLDNTNEHDKEVWITLKVLRGHMEDIYDLSWSPSSQFLVSGSVDNTAIIWDIQKGKSISILKDHKGFVQGVAWDPKNQYIATLSTDRILRIFDTQTKKVVHRISKSVLPVTKENEMYEKKVRLYHDDTLQTFFRHLCFSPDGKFLFTPAGVTDYDGASKVLHTTYVFSRFSLKEPSLVLPSPDQYTVAVKCCPILFKLRNKAEPSSAVIPLPYRVIFAVATKSSVYLYDTQQKVPFGLISNIHYTRLTDIAWSNDGKIMIVSSTDGFCSIITFDDGELGEIYEDLSILPQQEPTSHRKNCKNKQKENVIGSKTTGCNNTGVINKSDANNVVYPLDKLSHDIVIEKDIISSEEKFESPEKKMRIATPIPVRRHPRIPHSNDAEKSSSLQFSELLTQGLPEASLDKQYIQKATIEFHRESRILIPEAVGKTTNGEEALDAWPKKIISPKNIEVSQDSNNLFSNDTKENFNERYTNCTRKEDQDHETSNDCTEDIHLVYEESVDETQNKKEVLTGNETLRTSLMALKKQECTNKENDEKLNSNKATPERKNSRRVELKTISTPKSKKKL